MTGKSIYKDQQTMDDREELLSTTDTDASSADEEKHWSSADLGDVRWSKGRNVVSIVRDYWWLITTCMLGVIIILQLVIWDKMSTYPSNRLQQVGGDYLKKGPTCWS